MSTVSSTNTTQHTAAPPKGRTTAQNIGLILAFYRFRRHFIITNA